MLTNKRGKMNSCALQQTTAWLIWLGEHRELWECHTPRNEGPFRWWDSALRWGMRARTFGRKKVPGLIFHHSAVCPWNRCWPFMHQPAHSEIRGWLKREKDEKLLSSIKKKKEKENAKLYTARNYSKKMSSLYVRAGVRWFAHSRFHYVLNFRDEVSFFYCALDYHGNKWQSVV